MVTYTIIGNYLLYIDISIITITTTKRLLLEANLTDRWIEEKEKYCI